jgi:hypothetical protein
MMGVMEAMPIDRKKQRKIRWTQALLVFQSVSRGQLEVANSV